MKVSSAASRQAVACVFSAAVAWRLGRPIEGTEFGGGQLTGRLLEMREMGLLLFVAALFLGFFYRHLAAALSVLACLLCFPLCSWFIAPGIFHRVFRGVWSVPLTANVVWDRWAIAALAVFAITACICLRNLFAASAKSQTSG